MRLAVPAAVLLVAIACTPSAATPRHHCNPPGAKRVARDELGRVYYVAGSYGDRYYYACLYRTGRTLPLGDNPHSIGDTEMAGVDIAMPYVAFTEVEYSSQATTTILERLNMRSGRTTYIHSRGELRRFFATSFGAVVWAQDRPSLGTTEIEKRDKDGYVLLDGGELVNAKSLHLSPNGHRAYWRNDDQQKSARLR